jgi:uncharacterized phiE125 gp8 family phage protein
MWNPRERVFTPSVLTAPAVSVFDLKSHLRVSGSDEDYKIFTIGMAATQEAEQFTQRMIVQRACTLEFADTPSEMCAIELPGGAVSGVVVTIDGVTFDGASYQVKGDSPARLIPLVTWPVAENEGLAVSIAYQAGYLQTAMPAALAHAIMVIAADLYDTRERAVAGATSAAPYAARSLMEPFRISPIA